MCPKGILRKDGITYAKKSLQFKENISEILQLHLPPLESQTDDRDVSLPFDLQQQKWQQGWREDVTPRTLDRMARTLQQFARKHMLCWILTNDRRTEMYEELERIQEQLQSDMERIQWEKDDMEQQARLEIQVELQQQQEEGAEDQPSAAAVAVNEDLTIIQSLQEEVRALKSENKQLKRDTKSLKKDNKKLVKDLKGQAVEVEIRKFKVSMFEGNHQLIQGQQDLCVPNDKRWHDNLDQENAQWQLRRKQGHAYRDGCLKIMEAVKVRYPTKKMLGLMLNIMCQGFASQGKVTAELSSFKAYIDANPAQIINGDSSKKGNKSRSKSKERPHLSRASSCKVSKTGGDKKDERPNLSRATSCRIKSVGGSSGGDNKKKGRTVRRINSENKPKSGGGDKKDRKKVGRAKTDGEVGALGRMKKSVAPIPEETPADDDADEPNNKKKEIVVGKKEKTTDASKVAKNGKKDNKKNKSKKGSKEAESTSTAAGIEMECHNSFDWTAFNGSYDWSALNGGFDQAALNGSFDWTAHAAQQELDPKAAQALLV